MKLSLVLAVGLALATGCATTKSSAPTQESKRTHAKPKRVARAPVQAPPPEASAPAEDTTATTPPEEGAPPALVDDTPPEEGLASYYADSLAGNRTASGERYRPDDTTCAHRKHKFGTKLVVTNVDTGKSAVCRVNDRGPYVNGRVVDVSKKIAGELGMLKRGVIKVKVERAAEGAGS